MSSFDFDLFTIGAGSGGVRASRVAAGLGRRVAVAESGRLGGTCVNLGCVPKKLMFYAAQFGEAFEDSAGFGWSTPRPHFDWTTLITNKDTETARLNTIYLRLLQDSGVEVIRGHATLVDQHTVEVDGVPHTAEHILIATGSRPFKPRIPGIEHAISSDELFALSGMPQRIVVAGGGYIAVEFAGILNALGARVEQIYRGPLFLRGFDHDVRRFLAAEMVKRGVSLHFDRSMTSIAKGPDGLAVALSSGDTLYADEVLCATGRHPNTNRLGLDAIGVERRDSGAIVVDEFSRTTVDTIFAVGDCTDRMNLTPVAIAEAMALVATLYAGHPTAMRYENIPTAVFSQPNIGAVGLTEDEATARGMKIDVYRSRFTPMKHTLSGRDEKTLMKLIVDRSNDRVVGAHMVGPDAGEIIQGIAVALKCKATKAQFDATVGVHPTAAEEFVTMRSKD